MLKRTNYETRFKQFLTEGKDSLEPSNDFYQSLEDSEYDEMWDYVKNNSYMRSGEGLYEDDGDQVYAEIGEYAMKEVESGKEFSVSLEDIVEAADRAGDTLEVPVQNPENRGNYVGGEGSV